MGRRRREILKFMVIMGENQSDTEEYGTRPGSSQPWLPNEGGEGSSGHTLVMGLGGRGGFGQPGHVTGASWVSHFPARHSCIRQDLKQFFQLDMVI
jgi:hypothetical protein